ncbi:MAG: T9SS type A sorting domain-containing protein [Bacteroidales bacterium]|nr:T9SS type A sorting domain-containing protein [Bacteroidales bacterium]
MKRIKTLFVTLGLVLACSVAANAQTAEGETVAMADGAAVDGAYVIEATNVEKINVWPEVSSIKVMVDVEVADTVQIYNAVGRLVKTQKVSKGQGINVETLVPGLYTVRVGNKVGNFRKK